MVDVLGLSGAGVDAGEGVRGWGQCRRVVSKAIVKLGVREVCSGRG